MKLKLSFLALVISVLALAQSAPAYYNGIDFTKRGNELKAQLAGLISIQTHTTTYSELLTQYKNSDADPENPANILLIYGSSASGKTQRSRPYGSNDFNREHVFPKSLGSPNLGTSGAGADLHHIRPADIQLNSDRGSLPFADGSGIPAGKSNGGWYPGNEWKGDVARIILYNYLRYNSQTKPNVVGLGPNTYAADVPDIFFKWNIEDPVSDFEKQRQERAYSFQGNRNPFIDNPYLVTAIWGGPDATNTWPSTFQTTPVVDTLAPTAATNLAANNVTANTISLTWTPATDNIGVMSYNIYVNGLLITTINGSLSSATISGLAPNTSYTIYIIAKDAAGNTSPASNTITASTNNIVIVPPTSTKCGDENFESIPSASNSYLDRTWTSNGVTWTATLARTDLYINNRAILVNTSGKLTSSVVPNGVGSITLTTQLNFTGTPDTLDVLVNGTKVGTVPFSDEVETTTLSNINVSGNATISIQNNSTTAKTRVAIDDLSWTCYSSVLATSEKAGFTKKFSVFPNPVRNGELNVSGENLSAILYAQIFTIGGQLVQTIEKPFKSSTKIMLYKLPKGVYILKADGQSAKFIIE